MWYDHDYEFLVDLRLQELTEKKHFEKEDVETPKTNNQKKVKKMEILVWEFDWNKVIEKPLTIDFSETPHKVTIKRITISDSLYDFLLES